MAKEDAFFTVAERKGEHLHQTPPPEMQCVGEWQPEQNILQGSNGLRENQGWEGSTYSHRVSFQKAKLQERKETTTYYKF